MHWRRAFVFPSHTDTWGLVVNEAMACGLPVISSEAAGCTADLVQDDWNGRVVRRGDVRSLASAMEELATGPGCYGRRWEVTAGSVS